jgi:DNA-binding transcriptional regulator/RsmH inhibitor MraZ
MPRGDHNIEGVPYRIWIGKVERQNRIRVKKDIQDVVPWLKRAPGSIDCIGTPGPAGGLQVEPSISHETLRREFVTALGNTAPTSMESSESWVDATRLLASSWRVTVSLERSRVSLTLPEPTRRLLRLPEIGGMVVVFGFGEILEIWDAVAWHEHVRRLAKNKQSLIASATEEIE